MSVTVFDFEKPIVELEEQLQQLRASDPPPADLEQQLATLEGRLAETRRGVYGNLTAWQRVQFARHASRPHALDYCRRIFSDWTELHGDRHYGDDHACVAGFAYFGEQPVAIVGQQKGSDLRENVYRNYGSMHPEGYRKALRVMKMAEKFQRPVISFIDTGGAFPGVGAEERGQAEAIARNIMEMSTLRTPILCVVIGEGGSGGAMGIGVGDRLLMQENAYYSLISPEGCASILWRDGKHAPQAAECLKLTSADLKEMGIVDEVVPEPLGGAHRDPAGAARNLRQVLATHLAQVQSTPIDALIEQRYARYRGVGVFSEEKAEC